MQTRFKKLISRLKADTRALALPQGRRVGQPGHEAARGYLNSRLLELGLEPFRGDAFALRYEGRHPVHGRLQEFTNLVGVIPGLDRSLPPVLLGAHYDSVIDAPCADDNATSVALNLAIAEEFRGRSEVLERDLIIALFDAEEPPHFRGPTMGSTRFHEDHCADVDFAAVIVSDLIGHDLCLEDLGVGFPGAKVFQGSVGKTVFLLGAESDPAFPGIVEAAASEASGLRVFPTLNDYVGNLSDHHTFEQRGQPFLFLSCAPGRYYHDERDDLRWINFTKLGRITRFVASLIERIDHCPGDRRRARQDTSEFEIRMIRKAVGAPLPLLLQLLRADMPKNRRDLDRLIGSLAPGL